ncbi:uncharacterized protein LOC127879473 [Dreissena polymorpha]|uniref:Uncharacterized protein n=1 Tax=Dreissena polymorpha TaxID=45954 RepID=A0A9D4KDI4_DREPO|nr:uncharacterized protein LOC127879473 [Dreissena polymorpha]KAH3837342.1 hypothetical protein DPMN_110728 [Dreissena polymorpha]
MAFCGTASLWAKLAFLAIVIGLILFIVGFATPSWMVYQVTTTSIRVGLFQMKTCTANACAEEGVNSALKNDDFTVTQAFEILTFIMLLFATIAISVYVFAPGSRSKCLAITCVAFAFTASFLGFVGMICWLVYVPSPYKTSWSMGLTVLAAILACIAGLLIIPDILDSRFNPRTSRQISPNRRFMR